MSDDKDADILALTAQIVSAHVARNKIALEALPALIQGVRDSLATLGTPEPETLELMPAVPIRRSVFPDYIVCLEDGMKLKMLKRHLKSSFGLSPDAYRAKWKLSPDYPMVAPNYAKQRSELAKLIGLGRKPVPSSIPARRGRPPKSAATRG